MILSETQFLDGVPVGMVRQDTNTGQFAFSPIKGRSRLPAKDWKSINELKAAVCEAYQKKGGRNDSAATTLRE